MRAVRMRTRCAGCDGVCVDAWVQRLAQVGDIMCGAAISVAVSVDAMGEALRIAGCARLIGVVSGGLP